MWQCVFESYANFQIRQYKLEKFSIKPKNGRSRLLKDSSIKEKWIYLPIARNQKQFTLNKEPFTHFASLVDIRNDLIHFNHASMYFQKEAPLGVSTMGELNDWMKTGDFLSGSLFDSVLRYARAGSLIVRDMFYEYCKLTGEPLPAFLEGHEAVLKVKVVKKS